MIIAKLVGLFICLMLVLASCTNEGTPNTNANSHNSNIRSNTETPASTPAASEVADGRELFKQNCATCHRESGKGGRIEFEGKWINPDDLTSEKIKKFSDDKIAGYIREGVEDEGMPAFGDKLSEKQITAIIEYIRRDLQKMP